MKCYKYIDNNSFDIFNEKRENTFEVDDIIAKTISLLNKKAYTTLFCCSGHHLEEMEVDGKKQLLVVIVLFNLIMM